MNAVTEQLYSLYTAEFKGPNREGNMVRRVLTQLLDVKCSSTVHEVSSVRSRRTTLT
jgi:hypothetical protein